MNPQALFKPPESPTPSQLFAAYRGSYNELEAAHQLLPLLLPYHILPAGLLFVYLCIPHTNRPWLYAARWPLFMFIAAFCINAAINLNSINPVVAFFAGLLCSWQMVWCASWLIFKRPQWDAKRIEKRKRQVPVDEKSSSANGTIETAANGGIGEHGKIRRRTNLSNGSTTCNHKQAGVTSEPDIVKKIEEEEYYWQAYPDNFWERVCWVLDLLVNFRGPGWNWAIPTMPELPPAVKRDLGEPVTEGSIKGISSAGVRRYNTREELLRATVLRFVIGYFMIDILKVIMTKDPYFLFGPENDYPVPAYLSGVPLGILRFYRLFLAFLVVTISLEMAFLLMPIFRLILGPEIFGLRAEPWYYNEHWGSFKSIFDKGLNGLWGSWWHQTFRFLFAAPTVYLVDQGVLPSGRSQLTKFVGAFIAFFISGLFHLTGSMAQFPPTKILHPMIFFLLQAVGIIIQTVICAQLKPYIQKLPTSLRKAGNFAYTLGWLYLTTPWLVDDFARGAIFLYQPIPVSLFRGLGFGYPDEGFWCWDMSLWFRLYRGKHWWESGVAF